MVATEKRIEMEPRMQQRTVVEEKVDRLQEDVTGLKTDVWRLDRKIDTLNANVVGHRLETARAIGKPRDEPMRLSEISPPLRYEALMFRLELRESISKLHISMIKGRCALIVTTVIGVACFVVFAAP